jgi:hypothetical protein
MTADRAFVRELGQDRRGTAACRRVQAEPGSQGCITCWPLRFRTQVGIPGLIRTAAFYGERRSHRPGGECSMHSFVTQHLAHAQACGIPGRQETGQRCEDAHEHKPEQCATE